MSLAEEFAKHGMPKPRPTFNQRPELLLCANTVKPMHGVVPRLILGQAWWDETRKAAYASTGNRCAACGVFRIMARDRQWLEGHEVYQTDYVAGRQVYIETVPLCHFCHNFIHNSRLRMLVQTGEIQKVKFDAIMVHGKTVLKAAGMRKRRPKPVKNIASWGDWRLVLFGKEYPPKYKNYTEWLWAFGCKPDDE